MAVKNLSAVAKASNPAASVFTQESLSTPAPDERVLLLFALHADEYIRRGAQLYIALLLNMQMEKAQCNYKERAREADTSFIRHTLARIYILIYWRLRSLEILMQENS
jgi:hypothetical protein